MSETDDTDDDNEAEAELEITDAKGILEDISVNRKVSSITRNLHNLSISIQLQYVRSINMSAKRTDLCQSAINVRG